MATLTDAHDRRLRNDAVARAVMTMPDDGDYELVLDFDPFLGRYRHEWKRLASQPEATEPPPAEDIPAPPRRWGDPNRDDHLDAAQYTVAAPLRSDSGTFRNTYRPLGPGEQMAIHEIKQAAAGIEALIAEQAHRDPRAAAQAKTKLEEAVMWAVKGITA